MQIFLPLYKGTSFIHYISLSSLLYSYDNINKRDSTPYNWRGVTVDSGGIDYGLCARISSNNSNSSGFLRVGMNKYNLGKLDFIRLASSRLEKIMSKT